MQSVLRFCYCCSQVNNLVSVKLTEDAVQFQVQLWQLPLRNANYNSNRTHFSTGKKSIKTMVFSFFVVVIIIGFFELRLNIYIALLNLVMTI